MKKSTLILFLIISIGLLINSCKKESSDENSATITLLSPESPAVLGFGDYVDIYFNYTINYPGGARIWIQPYTNGDKSPGYSYSSSGVFSGEGTKQVRITIQDGFEDEVIVDQLYILCVDPDQTELVFEEYVDVNYTFN